MFINLDGEVFHVLLQGEVGAWVISCDVYGMPVYLDQQHLERAERIPTPEEYVRNRQRKISEPQKERFQIIEEMVKDPLCITDEDHRRERARAAAETYQTSTRRVNQLYYRFFAHGCLTKSRPGQVVVRKDFDAAIQKYYFSAKRNSLRTAYELFILENYTNNGTVSRDAPTWSSFKHYYQRHWSKRKEKDIARNGLSNYQRNERPIYGSAMQYRNSIGCYQIDETPADIFLVSRWDRSKVVGRPNIYLAVDTASGLIAGVYVGLDAGENAMTACLANAAEDKVGFCAKYGITIEHDDWPSCGLPSEIISDRGREFMGTRMDELCMRYGMDCQALPPFRADEKPLVERMIGMIQDSYESLLRGKGVIGEDVTERWATDYRKQAIFTLDEYTAIVIRCIVALNKGRVLTEIGHLPVEAPNTPATLWAWLESQGKTTLLDVDAREVYIRCLPRRTVKVTRKGIQYNGMRYLPERGTELVVGSKVEFAYDASDSSMIYLLGEKSEILPCYLAPSSFRYDGFTHSDVSVIKNAERAKRTDAREKELSARVDMYREIQKIVEQAEARREEITELGSISQHRDAERSRLI